MTHPWHRRDSESDKAWRAFLAYLHAEKPRVKKHIADALGASPKAVYFWSREYKWNDRILAYDQYMQSKEDDIIVQGREEMAREHLAMASKARTMVNRALEDHLAASEGLDHRDTLNYLKEIVRIERLIIGEATERSESKEIHDLDKLSPEEALILAELMDKIAR